MSKERIPDPPALGQRDIYGAASSTEANRDAVSLSDRDFHGWKTEEMLKRREWRTAEKIHAERKPCPPVQGQPAVKHFFHVFLSSELRFCRNTTDKQNANVDLDREKIWPK